MVNAYQRIALAAARNGGSFTGVKFRHPAALSKNHDESRDTSGGTGFDQTIRQKSLYCQELTFISIMYQINMSRVKQNVESEK